MPGALQTFACGATDVHPLAPPFLALLLPSLQESMGVSGKGGRVRSDTSLIPLCGRPIVLRNFP